MLHLHSPDRSLFAEWFRKRLFQYIEYSVEDDPLRLGIMTFGDRNFLNEVECFLPPFAGSRAWLHGLRRFCAGAKPVNYLMKVDWRGEAILAVSLYCRFVDNLSALALANALVDAEPLRWQGPPLQEIARALGTSWPHGIGFRLTEKGEHHSAVYNRISMPSLKFRLGALLDLSLVCGLPANVEREVRRDMAFIYRPGPVGVVGVDAAGDGRAAALKLDAESVPLAWALRFASARGTSPARIKEIEKLSHSLGVRNVGYLGLKYGPAGFDSWKVYLPFQPRLRRSALVPHLDVNQWATANSGFYRREF